MTATSNSRTVLITGGTGSFGTTMVRRLLATDVTQVRIFSRDEAKQEFMRRELRDERLRFYVGDVRDRASVEMAMRDVNQVFHAAALKQVPSCEFFPDQAVMTNVNGSANVLLAAAAAGVASVVCLSTDKAVYPVNAMGMTKALMEKTVQAFARSHHESGTVASVVRYGNVLSSRGSVVPLFVEQVRAGRPMTITDPAMTRFLITLAESVDLVDFAFASAKSGDIFVRKAPAATVENIALAVARLLDASPHMTLIGTRHGEKLAETLLTREEMAAAEDFGAYFRVPLDARSLDYDLYFDRGGSQVSQHDDYTSHNTTRLDVEGVIALLSQLPEFSVATP